MTIKHLYSFIKALVIAVVLLLPISIFGQFQPLHTTTNDNPLVKYSHITLEYSNTHKQAKWLYYLLCPAYLTAEVKRGNNFKADTALNQNASYLDDYVGTGYDRGHLCPAADMTHSKTAMSETFLLSNISPQLGSFNRGIWKRLEALVRTWAQKDTIYITTAGVLPSTNATNYIGDNKITVPDAFYKVVYSAKRDELIGFLIPHNKVKSTLDLNSFVVTIDSIESRTGIDFIHILADSVKTRLKSSKSDIKKWNNFN